MTEDGIFVIDSKGELKELPETPFSAEDVLQSLLERYPELIPGRQIDSSSPRQWLLITREAGVPGEEDGAGRWALDHLFVDQDGVPTLVEVKRSTDTRLRREVVGQMLDYAANAMAYWSMDRIRALFDANCEEGDIDAEKTVQEFMSEDNRTPESFWQQVKTNLQAGRVRLLFIADQIPTELARIIEFLNEQMDPAEVLGIEIRQFASGDLRTLVPRVVGQTVEAAQRKQKRDGSPRRKWNETLFFEELKNQLSGDQVPVIRRLYDFTKNTFPEIAWGTGGVRGSFNARLPEFGPRAIYSVYTDGVLTLNFGWQNGTEKLEEFRDAMALELGKVSQFDVPEDFRDRWVSLSVEQWSSSCEDFMDAVQNLLANAQF